MKNNARILVFLGLTIFSVHLSAQEAWAYVPDEATAIKIAVAVWEPIYGKAQIAQEKPYKAELTNGVWIVQGTLPEGAIGGVAVAKISKQDGKILRVYHTQ